MRNQSSDAGWWTFLPGLKVWQPFPVAQQKTRQWPARTKLADNCRVLNRQLRSTRDRPPGSCQTCIGNSVRHGRLLRRPKKNASKYILHPSAQVCQMQQRNNPANTSLSSRGIARTNSRDARNSQFGHVPCSGRPRFSKWPTAYFLQICRFDIK